MTVMAIGISALVAGFSSGIVALSNASRIGTAGTLADKQMEAFRAVDPKTIKAPFVSSCTSTDPSSWTARPECQLQNVTGPDGRTYEVMTTLDWACPLGEVP